MAAVASPPTSVNPTIGVPRTIWWESPNQCRGFLLQCTVFVNQQPALYCTEEGKISFVCSLLTGGRALEWITAVWSGDRSPFRSFEEFLQRFREVFNHPKDGRGADELLLTLSQGNRTAADYALTFRTLAARLLGRRSAQGALSTGLESRITGWTRMPRRGKDPQSIHWARHTDRLPSPSSTTYPSYDNQNLARESQDPCRLTPTTSRPRNETAALCNAYAYIAVSPAIYVIPVPSRPPVNAINPGECDSRLLESGLLFHCTGYLEDRSGNAQYRSHDRFGCSRELYVCRFCP